MNNHYTQLFAGGMAKRGLLLAALLAAGATSVNAQTGYGVSSAVNTTTTYTDLGTTGTAITTANADDANSAATPIGFSFTYNGTAFTDFVLNTNGFLRLGTAAPSAANLFYTPELTIGADVITSTDPADVNILAPFNVDLQAGTATGGAEYRVATTGTAPNRITTIQWKNVRDKAMTNSPQYDSFSFQVKLYETTNQIEFVYGAATAGTTGVDAFRIAAVGIKGSGSTAGQTVLANKTSSAGAWSTTTFITGNYTTSALNYRRSAAPDAGRTFRFSQVPAVDAATQVIYTLGKAPANSPLTVQAVVSNNGSAALTNLPVLLSVTGANSYTNGVVVPTLAAGASTTVSFTAFTPATTGNNTITVSTQATGDALTTNNSQTYTQVVTASTFSYANNATPNPNLSVGFTAATTGAFVAKFTTPAARTVTAVAANLQDPNTVGQTVYGVAVSATGAVLSRSADYVVLATDIATTKTFTLATPVAVTAGSNFYVGLVQTAASAGVRYYPMATLPETPTRAATFYTIAPFAATGGTLTDAAASNLGAFVLDAQTSIVQGTSAALNRAISLYPNPSTGLVNLDVKGANAKGNLSVTVTNMLGQSVYTTSAKDNFANQLDLSSLSNGMYLVKIQTGNDYTIRQLNLTK